MLKPHIFMKEQLQYITNVSSSESWETMTPRTTPLAYSASSVIDGGIYCMGGISYDNFFGITAPKYSSEHKVYTISTDTWSSKNNLLKSAGYNNGLVYNEKIYIVGGYTVGTGNGATKVYNPSTDTFSDLTNSNIGSSNTTADILNEKIYMISRNKHEMYDITTDTWTTKTTQSTAIDDCSFVTVNEKLYSIGGQMFSSTNYKQTQMYNPITNSWTAKTDKITATSKMTAVALGDLIYCFGGISYDESTSAVSYLNILEIYDTTTDTWTTGLILIEGICGSAIEVSGGNIYLIGGENAKDTVTNAVRKYTPSI